MQYRGMTLSNVSGKGPFDYSEALRKLTQSLLITIFLLRYEKERLLTMECTAGTR